MQTQQNKSIVLVTGGKGKTGSRVVAKLEAMGWPVHSASRSAGIPFDWEDASTWKKAVEGMEVIYITYQPDLAVPGAPDAIRKFTKTAVDNGVKKLILLSGRGEPEAEQCEQVVMNAGVDWTIVRASWFFQNFSEGYMLEPILAGHVVLPVGNIGEPFIDVEDIAEIVVAAITQTGHNKKLYEVTGPRLLTFQQAVEAIAAKTGRAIVYEQIPMEAYAAMLKEYQVPDDFIWLITYLFTEVLDGRNESITNGVEEALGKKARDFSGYVDATAATGIWNNASV